MDDDCCTIFQVYILHIMIERLAVERFMCESCGKTYLYRGYLSKHVCSHGTLIKGDHGYSCGGGGGCHNDNDDDNDGEKDDSKLIISNLLKQNNELLDIIRRQQYTIDALLGRKMERGDGGGGGGGRCYVSRETI